MQEAGEEFAKELAKVTTETPAVWDDAILASSVRKKCVEETEKNMKGDADHHNGSVMNLPLTRRMLNYEQGRRLKSSRTPVVEQLTEDLASWLALALTSTFQCKTRLASPDQNNLLAPPSYRMSIGLPLAGQLVSPQALKQAVDQRLELLVHDPDREPHLRVSSILDGGGRVAQPGFE